MDFYALEERLASYGSGGYYFLEAFILKLLELEAKTKGQEIIGQESRTSAFDASAPLGIGDIATPLVVEIIFSVSRDKLKKLFNNYTRQVGAGYGLLVVAPKLKDVNVQYFLSDWDRLAANPIHVWGEEKIRELILKHEKDLEEVTENLFSVRLKLAASRTITPWLEEREQIVQALSEQYRSGSFSLALGAGVSSSAGLPDWNTLLNSLFVSMLAEENIGEGEGHTAQVAQIVGRLMEVDGPSALMLARYIRKGLSAGSPKEQQNFVEAITKQLYALRNADYPIESKLITAVASLCTPTRTGAKIKSIITYNFDDLLERALISKGLVYKSVFEEFETPLAEELPVYHVHGFLPENREEHSNLDRCTLVFSEEGYHQIYRDAYHWSNLVQLSIFKETSCLMVGLSLTDPNLRRLLEIASKSLEKPKHFAFMRRLNSDKFKKGGGDKALKLPSAVINRFLDRHHSTNEELMRELGVIVVWYEEYDEIPTILDRIRKGQRAR